MTMSNVQATTHASRQGSPEEASNSEVRCPCPSHLIPIPIGEPDEVSFRFEFSEVADKPLVRPKRYHDEFCADMNFKTALDVKRSTVSPRSFVDPDITVVYGDQFSVEAIKARDPTYFDDAGRLERVTANTNQGFSEGTESEVVFVLDEAQTTEEINDKWHGFWADSRRLGATSACPFHSSTTQRVSALNPLIADLLRGGLVLAVDGSDSEDE